MRNQRDSIIVGIDDMTFYTPSIYLPIEELAKARNIEYDKLRYGLGLYGMAVPDVHEDAATMAANAALNLIEKNNIHPREIGRLYLGTESALDGAKPTATYVVEMLNSKLAPIFGDQCFLHCDVVDMTFACIGGVDALQNSVDWVSADEDRLAIVISSDIAKYELESTGEYTQGAGAVAMLVKHSPRLLAINNLWGTAMDSVHDFFKPKRKFTKIQLLEEFLKVVDLDELSIDFLKKRIEKHGFNGGVLTDINDQFFLNRETPIFHGPYSNECFQQRIEQAFEHFRKCLFSKHPDLRQTNFFKRWERMVFHLPYAFQAKRMFPTILRHEMKRLKLWDDFLFKHDLEEPRISDFEDKHDFDLAFKTFIKSVTKTEYFKNLLKVKIEKGQILSSSVGNVYTASIFLSLMSTLEMDSDEKHDLAGKKIGCFSYGSGSKSKVFEATLQKDWKGIARNFKIRSRLKQRTKIDYPTYEKLHRYQLSLSIQNPDNEFALQRIGEKGVTLGARYYDWISKMEAMANKD